MKSNIYTKFEEAILPYTDLWQNWVVSDYCFLSEKEIEVAALYLKTQTITSIATHLKRTKQTADDTVKRIRRKLIYGYTIFNTWKQNQKEDEFYPLNIPISCLKAPIRLKRGLIYLGNTLNEVLRDYSTEELLKQSGFGKGTVEDLRSLLDTYGYAKLLRESNKQPLSSIVIGIDKNENDKAIQRVFNENRPEANVGVMLPLVESAGEDSQHLLLPLLKETEQSLQKKKIIATPNLTQWHKKTLNARLQFHNRSLRNLKKMKT